MLSVHRLRDRPVRYGLGRWMLDSGAFTELARHGEFQTSAWCYGQEVAWWARMGRCEAAVSQDYMCEPMILARTGLTVAEHQRRTLDRYDALLATRPPVYILPVLQGYAPAAYADHVRAYGTRLALGAWVGVGSLCKRQGNPSAIVAVLDAVLAERPDLRLHGFGIKLTALRDARVRARLFSADSMAWSYAGRRQGRGGNNWREAVAYAARIRELMTGGDHAETATG